MKFKGIIGTSCGTSQNQVLESCLRPMRSKSKEMLLTEVESYSLSSPPRIFEYGPVRLIKKTYKYLANTLKLSRWTGLRDALTSSVTKKFRLQ